MSPCRTGFDRSGSTTRVQPSSVADGRPQVGRCWSPRSKRGQSGMGEHRFHSVGRSDPDDSNRSDLSSGKTDRLAVAEVKDNVFGCEVDLQADDAVPPQ